MGLFGNKSIFEKILLLVDGSESSINAARYAISFCKNTNAKLIGISVVDIETLNRLLSTHIFIQEEKEEYEREMESSNRGYLKFVEDLANRHRVKYESILVKGSIHNAVLEEAKKHKVNLIILGGWRRSVTSRDLLSREREIILDESTTNVIVVKKEMK